MARHPDRTPASRLDTDEVERLFEAAARLPADERESFLDTECAGRPARKAEVVSLLAHAEAAEGFFGRLGDQRPRWVPDPGEEGLLHGELAPGARVGRYRIVERLGAGGMGTVYRARDDALDRDVALKLVAGHLAMLREVRARFLAEARAAASLDHPNVCTVHEVGEDEGGRLFLAMTCYRGQTLRERLAREPVGVDRAVELAVQIARGIGAAHARGLVHRDVKPGNVMLVEDGSARILDFGLARVADAAGADPGATAGTVAYMSPEQARGEAVDHGTDLWSLGVVLYEMLAGRRPFDGAGRAEVLEAILHDEPRPLDEAAPHVPPSLARVVRKLLRKRPGERYGGTDEVLRDLERVAADTVGSVAPHDRGAVAPAPARRWVRAAWGGPLAFGLAVAAALWWPEPGTPPGLDPSVVAVLPFRVGGDASSDVLREGMVDLLVHALRSTEPLRPVDSRTVIPAWERAGGGERGLPVSTALELARSLHAGRLVMGEVLATGDRMIVTASLYGVGEGTLDATIREDGPADSLPALVDRVAVRLLSVEAGPANRLASITTGSLAALEPYLAGEAAYRRARWDEAARAFARAVERDSTFALAALMAARANDKAGPGAVAGDFGARAWRHRDRLGPRERAYLEAAGAGSGAFPTPSSRLASLQRLVTLSPDDPDAWFMLGEHIPHAMARAGASDTLTLRHAGEAFRKVLALDSTYLVAMVQLQLVEAALGDTAAAFRLARDYLTRVPDGLESDNLRCVLAGASATATVRGASLEVLGPAPLGRCLVGLSWFYPHAHGARDSVAALLDRASASPEVMALAGPMMYTVALDRGRPTDAKRYAAAFRQAGLGPWSAHVSAAIRDALYAGGDPAWAAEAATEIDAALAGAPADLPEPHRVEALCTIGQWRASRGDFGDAGRHADRLRTLGASVESRAQAVAAYCARLLDAWIGFENGATDLDRRVASLDGMLVDGPGDARLIRESAFLLARIHEAQNEPGRALQALDRAYFIRPAAYYNAAYLRERGRLALMTGDSAGARAAFRRYLAMRSDPEPASRAEVDAIATRLEALSPGGLDDGAASR